MGYDFSKLKPVDNDASWWSPKEMGDTLQGTLVAVQWIFNQGMGGNPGKYCNRFTILAEDGKHYMTNSPVVDRQMQVVALGQYVKIVHEGLQQKKKGPGTFRAYKVMAVPGAVNEEWLAQNQKNIHLLDCRLKGSSQEEEVETGAAFPETEAEVTTGRTDTSIAFADALDQEVEDAEAKKKRILDLAILKYGAKTVEDAQTKVVMATSLPFTEAYYDQILAKLG